MMKKKRISRIIKILVLTICMSVYPGQVEEQEVSAATLPVAYDSRDYGYITPKKSQVPYGNCWAFAATAASEASLIKSGLADKNIDLSEYHLAYYMYATGLQGMYEGGTNINVIEQYSKWYGPVSESVMPYSDAVSKIDPAVDLSNQCEYHLKNAIRANCTIHDEVKELIMEYGGVYSGVSVGLQNHYNDTGLTYNGEKIMTYHRPGKEFSDHAVCIIGWDDNFPKEYFNVQPENNGAWLVKDSDGHMPYTWVSYESFISDTTAYEYESVDKLKYVYSHNESSESDPISGVTHTYPETITKCMNVFDVENSQNTLEKLESVMVRNNRGCTRQICIYVNPVIKDGQIYSYEYKSKPFTITSRFYGTYKVDVPEDIYLNAGDRFAVEVSGDEIDDYPATIRIEPCFTEYIGKGESYVGVVNNGELEYKDMEQFFAPNHADNLGGHYGNLCITAYTNPTDIKPNTAKVNLDKTSVELEVNESETIHGTISVPAGTLGGVSYESADPDIANVDSNGKITAKKLGNTTIYVKAAYGTSVAECKVTVVPTLATSITMEKSVSLSTRSIKKNYYLQGVSGIQNTTYLNMDESSYTFQLHPVVDAAATNKNVVYEVVGMGPCWVDANGKITASNTLYSDDARTETVTVVARTTDGSNLTASCVVTVNQLYDPNYIFDTQNTNNSSTVTNTPITTPTVTVPSTVTVTNMNNSKNNSNSIKPGTAFSNGYFKYSITTCNSKYKEVEVTGITNKKATSVKVPSTVWYKGVSFKITGVNKKAFSGCKNLKSISIGSNMERIEKKAFSGCKNLKTIKMPGTAVRYVEKNAFKGIPDDVTVVVPKSRYGKYKKLLTNAGAKVSWKKK